MAWPFRILGMVAYLNYRMSRYRGNGIPVNWLVMFLLGIFTAVSINQVKEAYSNLGPVPEVTLQEIVRGSVLPDTQVRVEGHLYIHDALVQGKPEEDPDEVWIPLVDDVKRCGVYVKVGKGFTTKNRADAVITGMLRKIDQELASDLRINPRRSGDAMMNDQWMVVADEKPIGRGAAVGVAAALAIPLLVLLTLTLLRNTVFIPGGGTVAPLSAHRADPRTDPAAAPLESRATGQFVLEKHKGRFIEVPCVLAELESGQKAILANVDASVRMMGAVTSQRAGTWAMVIRNGSLGEPRPGTMYYGFRGLGRGRPALRIGYTDDLTGKARRMILSFPDDTQRQQFQKLLTAPIPKETPA